VEVIKGYKQTKIGIIPEDWEVFELGEVIDYIKGFAFKSSDYQDDGARIVRVSDTTYDFISDENPVYIDTAKTGAYSKWKLRENDLIITTVGSKPPIWASLVGKVIRVDNKHTGSLLNQNAVLIRAKDNQSHKQMLLLNNLRTDRYIRHIEAIYRGNANQASITLAELFKFPLALPKDDAEQRAIAAALSDVDALLSALEALIAKKRLIKQGAMQELLTGKKRLPGFKGEWEVKTLGDLFYFSGGFTASRDQLSSNGYCYLHYGDIHLSKKTFVDVKAEFQDIPKLNVPLKKVSSASLLEDGDIVFVDASEDDEGASRHVVIINPDKIPYISGLHTIVAKSKTDELEHQYRRYCFQTRSIKNQFLFFAVGTKVTGISKSNISKINLPVPSIPEQTAIAEILSEMDAEIAALEQRREKTRLLKQGMMQELLTGRIRLV
jgi:type I restriction enzyme, S subunit